MTLISTYHLFSGNNKDYKLQSKKHKGNKNHNTKLKKRVMRKCRSTPLTKLEYMHTICKSKLHSVNPEDYVCTNTIKKSHRIKKRKKLSYYRFLNDGHHLSRKAFPKINIETQRGERPQNYYKNRDTRVFQQSITCQRNKHHESIRKTKHKIEKDKTLCNSMRRNVTEAYFMLTDRDNNDQERSKNSKYYPQTNTVREASNGNTEFNKSDSLPDEMVKANGEVKENSFVKYCKFCLCSREYNKKEGQSKTKPKFKKNTKRAKINDANTKKKNYTEHEMANANIKVPNPSHGSTIKCESLHKNSFFHRCFCSNSRKNKQRRFSDEIEDKEPKEKGKKIKFIKRCFRYCTGKNGPIKVKKSKSITSLRRTREQKSQLQTNSCTKHTTKCNKKRTGNNASRITLMDVENLSRNAKLSETFRVGSCYKYGIKLSEPQVVRVGFKLTLKFKKNILSYFTRKKKNKIKENIIIERESTKSLKKTEEKDIEVPLTSAVQKKSSFETQNNCIQILDEISTPKRYVARTDNKIFCTLCQNDAMKSTNEKKQSLRSSRKVTKCPKKTTAKKDCFCKTRSLQRRAKTTAHTHTTKNCRNCTSLKSRNKSHKVPQTPINSQLNVGKCKNDAIKAPRTLIQDDTSRRNIKNTRVVANNNRINVSKIRSTLMQNNQNNKTRHEITNLSTKYKRKCRPFECVPDFCVPAECNPYNCLMKIINTTEPHELTSIKCQNIESESQTDVVKTEKKTIQCQSIGINNKNIRVLSKKHLCTTHTQPNQIIKARHYATNRNIAHKRKLRPFKCDPGLSKIEKCDQYDCLKIIKSQAHNVLTSTNRRNKYIDSQSDLIKTDIKAIQNLTDKTGRSNDKNFKLISKRHLNRMHRQQNQSKNAHYEIGNRCNKRKLTPINCAPGLCVTKECDPYLTRINPREHCQLTSITCQNKENDSETDDINTKIKFIQNQSIGINNKNVRVLSKKHLSTTCRQPNHTKNARYHITNRNTRKIGAHKRNLSTFDCDPRLCTLEKCYQRDCLKIIKTQKLKVLTSTNSQNDISRTNTKETQNKSDSNIDRNSSIVSKNRLNTIQQNQSKKAPYKITNPSTKHEREFSPFECAPEFCVSAECDPYNCLMRINAPELNDVTSVKYQNKENESQIYVVKTKEKAIQNHIIGKSNKNVRVLSKKHLCIMRRQSNQSKKARHDITKWNAAHKRNPRPFECEPGLCVLDKCDPYNCLKRIQSQELNVLISTNSRNKESESQTDVIKTDKIAIQNQRDGSNNKNSRKPFECEPGFCVTGECDGYSCLMKINTKEPRELMPIKCQEKEKKSQTDVIKTKKKEIQHHSNGINNKNIKVLYKKHLSTTHRQRNQSKKTRHDIANRMSSRKRKLRPFECEPGLCILEKCDPYDCLKIIKSHELNELTSTNHRNKDSESQTDIVKTDIKAIQNQTEGSNEKASRIISKRHLHTMYRQQDQSIKARPEIINVNTKRKHSPFECEPGICVTGKCESYNCLMTINSRDLRGLTSIMCQNKENESQTDVVKTKRKAIQNQTVRINNKKTRVLYKKNLSTTHRQPIQSKKSRYYITYLNTEHKRNLRSFECEAGLCTPEKCDPHDCLKSIKIREPHILTPTKSKNIEKESQTDVTKTQNKTIQKQRDKINTNNVTIDSKGINRIKVSKGNSISKNTQKKHIKKTRHNVTNLNTKHKQKLKSFQCEPGFCVPKKCNPYECLMRINAKDRWVITPNKIKRREKKSQIAVIKTESKTFQNQTDDRNNINARTISKQTNRIRVSKGHFNSTHGHKRRNKVGQYNILNLNTQYTGNLIPFECEPGLCVTKKCDPYDCLKRIEIKPPRELTSIKNIKIDMKSQTDVIKPGRKANQNQTDERNNNNAKTNSKQIDRIKVSKGHLSSTRGQKIYKKMTRYSITNLKSKSGNLRLLECEPGLCVIKKCDPYDCLKRIKIQESHVSTSSKNTNPERESQTYIYKTERKAIQNQMNGNNNKSTRTQSKQINRINFSKTHLSSMRRRKKHSKKTRYDMTNLNTKHKRKLEPFECEAGLCVPDKCDGYNCLMRIIKKESWLLAPINIKKKERKSQTDVIKTERKTIQNQIDDRNTNNARIVSKQTNRLQISKRHLSSTQRQKKHYKIGRYNITNVNTKYMEKLTPFECEPGLCVLDKCDPYDCLKLIQFKESHVFTSYKNKKKEMKSQTDVIKTGKKGIQIPADDRFINNARTVSKSSNRIFVSKRHLSPKHRQKNHSKKIRHDMANLNTQHKRKFQPFECEQGLCVPGKCDPYDCLKTIKTQELSVLTSTDSRHKDNESQTDVIKTDIKASQNQSDGNNDKNSRIFSKIHLNTMHRQQTQSKKTYYEITNVNTKRKFGPFECEPGLCVVKKCDPYDCLRIIEIKDSRELTPIKTKKIERKSQTDVIITGKKAVQNQSDERINNIVRIVSKHTNPMMVSQENLSSTHRKQKPIKKAQYDVINQNIEHKETLRLFECEPTFCVPGKCDPYDCLMRINNKESWVLPSIKSNKKDRMYKKKNPKQTNRKNDSKRHLNKAHKPLTYIEKEQSVGTKSEGQVDVENTRKTVKQLQQTTAENLPEKIYAANVDSTKIKQTRNDVRDPKSKTRGTTNQTGVINTKEGRTQTDTVQFKTIQNKSRPKFVTTRNICKKQSRKTYIPQKNIKKARNDGTKAKTNDNKRQIDTIDTKSRKADQKKFVQKNISKKELRKTQKPQTKTSQTIMRKTKNYATNPEHYTRNTDRTKQLINSNRTQNSKEYSRHNIKTVKDKNIHNLKLQTSICEPNFCIPKQCHPYTCLQRIVNKATNTFTPNTVNKNLDIRTGRSERKSQTETNIMSNAKLYPKQSAERYVLSKQLSKIQISDSNMERRRKAHKQLVILKIKPNECERGLCNPILCDPFKCFEVNKRRRTHATSKSDLRKSQSHTNTTMTTTKATKSQTYIKSIQNTKARPKQSIPEIVSNNKSNIRHRLHKNVTNQNDVPILKERRRIQTLQRKSQTDTRTYSKLKTNKLQSNAINNHNDVINLKTNMPKQQPNKCKSNFCVSKQWYPYADRVRVQKCNSDFCRRKIRTIKTSESDNSHSIVVRSQGQKNLILKRCFKHGIMHKEKYANVSSQTSETNRRSKDNNINKSKKSKSDYDFTWVQNPKRTPSVVVSKHKNTYTNSQKPKMTSSTIKREQASTHSTSKQKSNTTKKPVVNKEKISKKFKLNEIFRVGSSFKFGIKFSEPQAVRVRSSFKLSFKFNRHILPSFISDKKKTETKQNQYVDRKTYSAGNTESFKKKDFEIPSKQLLKKGGLKKSQYLRTPSEQKRNKVRSSFISPQDKNIYNTQTKFHQNNSKNYQQIFYGESQRDVKLPRSKKMIIRNQISSTPSLEPVQNRDNNRISNETKKTKSRIENLKKSKEQFRNKKSCENSGTDNSMQRKKKSSASQTALKKQYPGSCDRCNSQNRVQRKQYFFKQKSYDCQAHICKTSTRRRDPLKCLKKFLSTNSNIEYCSEPKEITKAEYKQIVQSSDINNPKREKKKKSILINPYECRSRYCLQKGCNPYKYLQKTDVRNVCVTYSSFSRKRQTQILKYRNKDVQVMTLKLYECESQFCFSKRCEPFKYLKGNNKIYADVSSPSKSETSLRRSETSPSKSENSTCQDESSRSKSKFSLKEKNKSITTLKPYECKRDTCMIKLYNSYEFLKRIKKIKSFPISRLYIRRHDTYKMGKNNNNKILKKIQRRHRDIANFKLTKTQMLKLIPNGFEREFCASGKSYKSFEYVDRKNTLTRSNTESSEIRNRTKVKQSTPKTLQNIAINSEHPYFRVSENHGAYKWRSIIQRKEKNNRTTINFLKKNVKIQVANASRRQRAPRISHNDVTNIKAMRNQTSKLQPYKREYSFTKLKQCNFYQCCRCNVPETQNAPKTLNSYKHNAYFCISKQRGPYQCEKRITKSSMNKCFEQSFRNKKTKYQQKNIRKSSKILSRSELKIPKKNTNKSSRPHKNTPSNLALKEKCTGKRFTKTNRPYEFRKSRKRISQIRCNNYQMQKLRGYKTKTEFGIPDECNPYKHLLRIRRTATHSCSKIRKSNKANHKLCKTKQTLDIPFCVLEKYNPSLRQRQNVKRNAHTLATFLSIKSIIINKNSGHYDYFCELEPFVLMLISKHYILFHCLDTTQNRCKTPQSPMSVNHRTYLNQIEKLYVNTRKQPQEITKSSSVLTQLLKLNAYKCEPLYYMPVKRMPYGCLQMAHKRYSRVLDKTQSKIKQRLHECEIEFYTPQVSVRSGYLKTNKMRFLDKPSSRSCELYHKRSGYSNVTSKGTLNRDISKKHYCTLRQCNQYECCQHKFLHRYSQRNTPCKIERNKFIIACQRGNKKNRTTVKPYERTPNYCVSEENYPLEYLKQIQNNHAHMVTLSGTKTNNLKTLVYSNLATDKILNKSAINYERPSYSMKIYKTDPQAYTNKIKQRYECDDKFTYLKRYEKRYDTFLQSHNPRNYVNNGRDDANGANQRIPTVAIAPYYENNPPVCTPGPFNIQTVRNIKIVRKKTMAKLHRKSVYSRRYSWNSDISTAEQIDLYEWTKRIINRYSSKFESKINKSDGIKHQTEKKNHKIDLGFLEQRKTYAAINNCTVNHLKKPKVNEKINKDTGEKANITSPFGNQNIVVSYANQKYFHAMPLRLQNKLWSHDDSNRHTKRRKKNRETDSEELQSSMNFDDQKSLKVIYSNYTARKSILVRFKERFVGTLNNVKKIFGLRNNDTTNVVPKQLCTSTCKKLNIICRTRRRAVQCLHPCTSKTCIIERQVENVGSAAFIMDKMRRKNKNQGEPFQIIMPYSSKKYHRYMSDLKIVKRNKRSSSRTLSGEKRNKASQIMYLCSDSGTDTRRKSENKKL